MKLVTVEEMRAVEREADASGLSYSEMMENAGANLARAVRAAYPDEVDEGVLGLAGAGNNGGDTLVALADFAQRGVQATAYLVRPRPEDDPLVARLLDAGGKVYRVEQDGEFEQLHSLLETHAVLLDGVLGTGIRLPLKPEIAAVLDYARLTLLSLPGAPHVVAVDCPSGVDSDSGEAAAETIPAELTVTMAAVKRGLLALPAFELLGRLEVVEIGLDAGNPGMKTWRELKRSVFGAQEVGDLLPSRPASAHKGTFGTALVIAGSQSYTGAALLSGEAAYRVGAGLVTLAAPEPLYAPLAGQLPEATWILLPHEGGFIREDAADALRGGLSRASAALLGPGFGMQATTGKFLAHLLGEAVETPALPPLVVDADGLKLLAGIERWYEKLPAPAVLTPHPGEMSILTGLPKEEIQADRIGTAERFSRAWGHVVVLKGAFTVVAAPDGCTTVIPYANAALARAGTGDVLAGMIVGLRAQGVPPFGAAGVAAWMHAQAGELAASYLGTSAAVLAGDVLRSVPDVIAGLGE